MAPESVNALIGKRGSTRGLLMGHTGRRQFSIAFIRRGPNCTLKRSLARSKSMHTVQLVYGLHASHPRFQRPTLLPFRPVGLGSQSLVWANAASLENPFSGRGTLWKSQSSERQTHSQLVEALLRDNGQMKYQQRAATGIRAMANSRDWPGNEWKMWAGRRRSPLMQIQGEFKEFFTCLNLSSRLGYCAIKYQRDNY